MSAPSPILEVKNLSVSFDTLRGPLTAVDRLSFSLNASESLGIVGESGCGKSLTSLALMGLLPSTAITRADQMTFKGQDLLKMSETDRRQVRGHTMSMIFQDPMSSLNPSFNVEFQLLEALSEFPGDKKQRCRDLLGLVGIAHPDDRLRAFPHQLSGGMCQRVMIAMAIATEPDLLIADEPTTALDVTIQAQILDLIQKIQKEKKMALILITHDIGVVAKMTRRAMVMYAGQKVEEASTEELIRSPRHPYTEGLLACMPSRHFHQKARTRLPTIRGSVPDLVHRPSGCQLHPRCSYVQDRCKVEEPTSDRARCHFPRPSP